MHTSNLDFSDVIWRDQPITELAIDMQAALSGDYNIIHMNADAAIKACPGKANGRIAHAALIFGYLSAAITKKYGDYTQAREMHGIKFSQPFCPGDYVGFRIREVIKRERMGLGFCTVEIELFRRRDGEIKPATENLKIRAEVSYPLPIEELKISA